MPPETPPPHGNINWQSKAHDLLIAALRTQTLHSYHAFAQAAAIPPPHSIHQLTDWLEHIMEIDSRNHAPLRAALIVSKHTRLPARGFFDKAQNLGHTDISTKYGNSDWHKAYCLILHQYWIDKAGIRDKI